MTDNPMLDTMKSFKAELDTLIEERISELPENEEGVQRAMGLALVMIDMAVEILFGSSDSEDFTRAAVAKATDGTIASRRSWEQKEQTVGRA